MFGPVPKVLWARKIPPDRRNRIVLGTNCLLIRGPRRTILVETGMGTKLSPKQRAIYGVSSEDRLVTALARLGVTPEQVETVVLTHLHLDHAGGATRRAQGGGLVPTFPKARYVIQREEWESAVHPSPFSRGSYWTENFLPLQEAGRLEFVEGDVELGADVRACRTGAHTRGHQIVLIESQGARMAFLGDLIPTTAHLRLPWICAYDHYPLELVELKRRWLDRLVEERWQCVWYHDARVPVTLLTRTATGEVVAEPVPGGSGTRGPARSHQVGRRGR